MNILSPSILAADFTRLGEQIREVDEAGAQYIHIDVMDGMFVPSISYGMPVIRSIRRATDKPFDVHLMIAEPVRYVKDFADAGADIITFHLEAAKKPDEVIDEIHSCGKRAGIAIKPETAADAVLPYIEKAEMVLVMTVEPGFGGQKLIHESIGKIKEVKSFISERGLHTDIQADGGIYLENVGELLKAGANVIVSGSGVFKGEPAENVQKFLRLLKADK